LYIEHKQSLKFMHKLIQFMPQATARLPDIQDIMISYFVEHSSKAAEGIEILPGVQTLLQELKVRTAERGQHSLKPVM
jgi:beta-phosphoglucomutase-like phosphatase (HAD superfamily)